MIYFDFLHTGAGGPLGKNSLGNVGSKYLLVITEHGSGYVWLEPAAVCLTSAMAETLLR